MEKTIEQRLAELEDRVAELEKKTAADTTVEEVIKYLSRKGIS